MADDTQLAPEEELDPNAVPDEGGGNEPDTTTNDELDPVEEVAAELGWTSKDQFKGDPDDWKPAKEFLRAGRDIQRSLSRELKEVKSTVSNMSRVSQALLQQQLADRDAYWAAERDKAIELGDRQAINEADQQRALIRQNMPQVQAEGPSSEALDFTQRNPWFNKDLLATERASQVCQIYASRGIGHAEQLQAAEETVRREFPHLFSQGKQAPGVNSPSTRTSANTNRKKGFNDLPEPAKKAALDFEERAGVPRDTYAAKYFERERKVG